MGSELKLHPEELFVLCDLMDASLIDYSYIAEMHEIEKNYAKIREKAIQDLARARVLSKRLSGEIAVQPDAAALLHNVFEGTESAELEICVTGEQGGISASRYHFCDGSVTCIVPKDGEYSVSAVTADGIRSTVAAAVGTHAAAAVPADILPEKVTRMLTARRSVVDVGKRELIVFEQDGGLFLISEDETPQAVSDADAVKLLYETLIGE